MANPVDNLIFHRVTQLVLDNVWPDKWSVNQKVELIDTVLQYHESSGEYEICSELNRCKDEIAKKE